MLKQNYSKIAVLADSFTLKGSISDRFIFNLHTMKKYSIDAEQYEFLIALNGSHSFSEILKEYDSVSQRIVEKFAKELLVLGAIRFVEEKRVRSFPDLAKNPQLRSVHFEMTRGCNMRCLHCYQEAYTIDAQNADLTFDEIIRLAEEMRILNVEKIGVSGGEPFMRDDLFDLLQVFEEKEIAISSILTNGLKLKRDAIKKIGELDSKFPVFVSLDGLRPSAMLLRGVSASKCEVVFNDIVKNIKEAIGGNIPVVINTAVTKENVSDLVKMYDWFRLLGVFGWRVALPKMAGAYSKNYATFSIKRDEVFKAYLAVISRHLETGGVESGFELQIEHFFRKKVFENLEPLFAESFVCDYEGKMESCCIKPDGSVTPCPLYLDLVIGNVRDSSLGEIWYSKRMQKVKGIKICEVEKCRNCSLISICATGCRANAYFLNGSIFGVDDDACAAVKFFLKKVIPLLERNKIRVPVAKSLRKRLLQEERGI